MSREMKDSGVEWIGEIPKDWSVTRIKNVLFERKENNVPVKTNRILSLMKDRGVIPYEEKGDIGNKAKEDVTKYKIAYPSDIVLNSMNIIIGSVGISDYYGAVSPVYYVLNVKDDKISNKFINYVFHTKEFQNNLKGIGNGILEHRMRIKMDKLNNELITIPTINIQNKIVKYLDKVIGIIDLVIYDTYLSIEELKKYKQSLITEVVTKGLNKNVEMKDSGIEWIGEIPKDWSIVKINKVAKIKNGKEVSTETGVIPVYGSGGIFKYTDDFLYEGESVLFGRKGTIGKPIYTNSKIWTVDTMFYTEIKNTIIAKLFYYFLTAFPWSIYETKTALPSIVGGEIEQSKILLPNKKTQQEIVNYLDEKTEAIDNIVESKYILIREYESYKKSLIYEYVTGKKEVEEEVE